MPEYSSLQDLQNAKGFGDLDPAVQQRVAEKVAAKDQGYQGLADNVKQAVMDKILNRKPAGTQPLPTKLKDLRTPDPTGPYVEDKFKKGVASLPKLGLSTVPKIAGAPDVAGKTSQWIDDMLGIQNTPAPKDEYGRKNKASEYFGAMAEFTGASIVPGIGVVSGAERKLLAAVVEEAGALASGTSSVEGRELGREMAEQFGVDPERGAMIGEVGGSFLGPGLIAGAADKAQKAGAFAGRTLGIEGPMGRQSQLHAGRAMASAELRSALEAHRGAPVSLKEVAEIQKRVKNFRPTLGQASGAPGVVAIESEIAARSPQTLAKHAERAQANLDELLKFHEESFPETGVSPIEEVRKAHEGLAVARTKQVEGLDRNIATLAEKQAFQDNAAIGEELRGLRDKRAAEVRSAAKAKYDDVYVTAATSGVNADVTDLPALINKVSGSPQNAAQLMPRLYADLKDAATKYVPKGAKKGAPLMVPFAALHSMLKRGNADLMAAVSRNDMQSAHFIQQVLGNLNGKVKTFEGPEYGHVAEKLRGANEFWQKEYAQVFREGAGGRMAQFNRFGDTTHDEDIVRKLFWKPGKSQGMEDFAQIFGKDPRAYKALENGVMDIFAKAVVREGQIQPKLVETFMRQHASSLEMVPGLKQKLGDINVSNDALLKRRHAIQEEQRVADKSAAAKIAQSDQPDQVISHALTDKSYMDTLLAQAKTPETKQALARSLAQGVMAQKEPYAFLMRSEARLKPVMNQLGPEHWKNLETLGQMKRVLDRVQTPTSANLETLQDIGTKLIGTPVKSVLTGVWGNSRVYQSRGYFTLNLAGRYIYKIKTAEANRLLEEAIYDPNLAASLAEASTKGTARAVNKLKNHAWSHGVRVLAITATDTAQKGPESDD